MNEKRLIFPTNVPTVEGCEPPARMTRQELMNLRAVSSEIRKKPLAQAAFDGLKAFFHLLIAPRWGKMPRHTMCKYYGHVIRLEEGETQTMAYANCTDCGAYISSMDQLRGSSVRS